MSVCSYQQGGNNRHINIAKNPSKCGQVQIFENDSNTPKSHSRGNEIRGLEHWVSLP
jgi:hypothetical protein